MIALLPREVTSPEQSLRATLEEGGEVASIFALASISGEVSLLGPFGRAKAPTDSISVFIRRLPTGDYGSSKFRV